MRKVTLDDIVGLSRYAAMRDEFRRKTIALKRDRRVSVGDSVTLVFENFDTVLFQVQEMLHVERISDIDKVREECDVYNELLPADGELSATLFVEITDPERIADALNRLVGIDEHVALRIGGRAYPARFEAGRSRADRISAVQYLRFPLDEPGMRLLRERGTSVEVVIDHPNYIGSTQLAESQRASLAADLAA